MAAKGPSQHPDARYPVEPPNGGYVLWSTSRGVTAMVREDDPEQAARPDRWRKVDGSRWYTWRELNSTGTLRRLYTAGELAGAPATAAGNHLHPAPDQPAPEGVPSHHQPHYHHLPVQHLHRRLPAGDRRLLAAIGDGRVFVYEAGRDRQVHTRGLSIHRDDLHVTAPAITSFRQRRAAGLTGQVHMRLARLFGAGLLAAPVNTGRPGGLAPGRPEPYLLTRAGQQAVTRSRSYRGHPQPMTLQHQPRQATGEPSAAPRATAATGPRPPEGVIRNPAAGPPPHPATPAAPGQTGLGPGVIRSPAHTAARPAPSSLAAAPAPPTRPPRVQPPTTHSAARGRT